MAKSSSAAIRAGRAYVALFLKQDDFQRQMRGLENRMTGIVNRLQGIALGASAAFAASAFGLGKLVSLASSAQESINRFNVTFGESAAVADKWARKLAITTNRDIEDVRDGYASFVSMLKAEGKIAPKDLDLLGKKLTRIAIDLSSFQDIPMKESFERLRSMLAGSTQVMDIFGINVREAAVGQKLLDMGMSDNVRTAEMWQKQVARILVTHEQLTRRGVMGDAARTAYDFANAMKGLTAAFREFGRAAGSHVMKRLEPMVALLGGLISGLSRIEWVSRNVGEGLMMLVLALGGLAAFTLAATGLGKLYLMLMNMPAVIRVVMGTVLALTFLFKKLGETGVLSIREISFALRNQQWAEALKVVALDFEIMFKEVSLGFRTMLLDVLDWFGGEIQQLADHMRKILAGKRGFGAQPEDSPWAMDTLPDVPKLDRALQNRMDELTGLRAQRQKLLDQLAGGMEDEEDANLGNSNLPRSLISQLPQTALLGSQEFYKFLRNDIPKKQLDEAKKTNNMLDNIRELIRDKEAFAPVRIP